MGEDNDFEDAQSMEGIGETGDSKLPFGHLRNQAQGALDQCQNFIEGMSSYLLYLWEMLKEHNLIQSSMQRLSDGVGCDDGGDGVPS